MTPAGAGVRLGWHGDRLARYRNGRNPSGAPSCRPGARPARKRPIILLVVGSLVASMAVQSLTADPVAAQTADLCDTGGGVQFSDVSDRDYAAAYILCMKALGLSVGKGGGEYGPDDLLTRAEMATFLVRLWKDVLGRECPDVGHPFEDVRPSSTHAASIGCLYGLGITRGTGPTTYGPSTHLKAWQISLFLMRLWELLDNTCPSGESDLVRAGACLTALRVAPDAQEATSGDEVTRAQMAVYLIGLWRHAAGHGAPPPPPYRPTSAARGEACGLDTVGDWFYDTLQDPEYGLAHTWSLWAADVSWERTRDGLDDECRGEAQLSLVCWEDGEWYYLLTWHDVGQVQRDARGYVSIDMDPGDPDLAWNGRFSIETGVTEDGDPFWYTSVSPDSTVEYDWADYVDYAVGRGRLQVAFPDTGARIVFDGAGGWQDVFEGCTDVLPGEATGYSPLDACRPDGLNAGPVDEVTAGFPLPSWAASSAGVFKAAVLLADFPDAQASDNDKADVERNLADAERYLETLSGGRLDVQFHLYPGWLTARRGWQEYLDRFVTGDPGLSEEIVQEIALGVQQLHDFDGSDYDSMMVVLPRSGFGGGLASTGSSIGNAANVTRWSLINNQVNNRIPTESRDREWWFTAAHELVHNLGLADLYAYDPDVRDTPDPPGDKHWVRFDVGLMGLGVNFPAQPDAFPYTVDWPPEFIDQTDYDRHLEAREMLAWSLWQLGWLDEARVACVGSPTDVTVELTPAASAGGGTAMVAIPHHADDRLVIVVESRRPVRYDRRETVDGVADDGVPYKYSDHSLPGEGVIVYLVQADRRSGELPVLLWTDSGAGEVDHPPIMTPGSSWWIGEPGTANGQYRIEVVSSTDDTDTIRITFTP